MEEYDNMGLTEIKNKTYYMTMCYEKYFCNYTLIGIV